jgi:hypothetical protein
LFGSVDTAPINEIAINLIRFGVLVAIISILIFVVLNRLRVPRGIASGVGSLASLYVAYRLFLYMFG